MFIGHYAMGFVLKKNSDAIPLWWLLLATQLSDIIAFSLVLLGIERIAYFPSNNPFLRTTIEFVPYSHSLLANFILAVLVFLVMQKIRDRRSGIILGLAVLSHWFIDLLVHRADMPLIHNSFKTGLGLWQYPRFAFLSELAIMLLAAYYLLKNSPSLKRHLILVLLLAAGFSGMFFAPEAEASPAIASFTSLALYAFFTTLAFWCERNN